MSLNFHWHVKALLPGLSADTIYRMTEIIKALLYGDIGQRAMYVYRGKEVDQTTYMGDIT